MSWGPQVVYDQACLHGAGHLKICSRWALPLLGLSWGPFPHLRDPKASLRTKLQSNSPLPTFFLAGSSKRHDGREQLCPVQGLMDVNQPDRIRNKPKPQIRLIRASISMSRLPFSLFLNKKLSLVT